MSLAYSISALQPTVIQPPIGSSQLPIYELDREHVQSKRCVLRPFELRGFTGDPSCLPTGSTPDSLNVDAWALFHATKKAEYKVAVAPETLGQDALGLSHEQRDLLRWQPSNLRLNNGMSARYDDFSKTSLSGRIAQGMTYLFMYKRGYVFGERITTFINRNLGEPGFDPQWRTKAAKLVKKTALPEKSPDFIFEKETFETALAESKGRFVSVGKEPPIASDLKAGLKQLSPWANLITPGPKSFAVGTYLREVQDELIEPSLISFVDPDPPSPPTVAANNRYPNDAIRRGNYSAWLYAMGFREASVALATRQSRVNAQTIHRMPTFELNGKRFAFVVTYIRSKGAPEMLPFSKDDFWKHPHRYFFDPPFFPFLLGQPQGLIFGILGIELGILGAVSRALASASSDALLSLEIVRERAFPAEGTVGGSVFADGTMLGELTLDWRGMNQISVKEVKL